MNKVLTKTSLILGALFCSIAICNITAQNTHAAIHVTVDDLIENLQPVYQSMIDTYNESHTNTPLSLTVLEDQYFPIYKPESIKAYINLNHSSGLEIQDQNGTPHGLDIEPIITKLTNWDFAEYKRFYSYQGPIIEYLNTEDEIVCTIVDSSINCSRTDQYQISSKWKEFANSIGEAYFKAENSYPHIVGINDNDILPEIQDSEYKPYQYVTVNMYNYIAMFYRKSPTSEWVYFKGTQTILNCSDYTGEAQKGFAGRECYLPGETAGTVILSKVTVPEEENEKEKEEKEEGEKEEEESLPVPDTGFFTGEMDGTKAIIYAGSAILGTGALYLVIYSVKRSAHRNRFRK